MDASSVRPRNRWCPDLKVPRPDELARRASFGGQDSARLSRTTRVDGVKQPLLQARHFAGNQRFASDGEFPMNRNIGA